MVKNLNGVCIKLIKNKALLRLNMYILATKYLEKGAICFTKVIKDDEKIIEDSKKIETIFNLEKKTKKRLYIKKNWMRGFYCL